MPSVPKRRAIGQRCPALGDGVGVPAGLPEGLVLADGLALGGTIGTPVMITVTFDGLAATRVVPAGRSAVTGTSAVPGTQAGHVEVGEDGGR